ncbi:MAG: hypothetical protein WAO98_02865 [Alphaproteobacteria bacterium]
MNSNMRNLLILVVVVVLGFLAYSAMQNAPDNRNAAERVGDAIHDLPKGVDKAADQLGDRSPAQKLGDKIEDTVDGK